MSTVYFHFHVSLSNRFTLYQRRVMNPSHRFKHVCIYTAVSHTSMNKQVKQRLCEGTSIHIQVCHCHYTLRWKNNLNIFSNKGPLNVECEFLRWDVLCVRYPVLSCLKVYTVHKYFYTSEFACSLNYTRTCFNHNIFGQSPKGCLECIIIFTVIIIMKIILIRVMIKVSDFASQNQKCFFRSQFSFVWEEFKLNLFPQLGPVWHVVWQFVRCNEIQKDLQHRQPPSLPSVHLAGWPVWAGSSWAMLRKVSRGSHSYEYHSPNHPQREPPVGVWGGGMPHTFKTSLFWEFIQALSLCPFQIRKKEAWISNGFALMLW